MKKTILVFVIFFVAGSFFSCKTIDYAQPGFEIPKSAVFDSYSMPGRLKDFIRLVNQSSKTGFSFRVYYHNPDSNAWEIFGVGNLKEPGDRDFVKSALSGKLDKFRYYAIEAMDGNKYNYSFVKTRSDLYINIFD